MITEFFALMYRRQRYRQISELVIPIITAETQKRVDKTLTDAYEKSMAQGATPEQAKGFGQQLVNQVNELLAKENALRVRQWTECILELEERR